MRVRHIMCVFLMTALLFGCASPHYTVTKPAAEEIDMAMVHIVMHLLFMEEGDMMSEVDFLAKIPDAATLPEQCRNSFSEEGYTLIKEYAKKRYGSDDPEFMQRSIFVATDYLAAYVMLNFGDGKPPLTIEEAAIFEEVAAQSPGVLFFGCLAEMYDALHKK